MLHAHTTLFVYHSTTYGGTNMIFCSTLEDDCKDQKIHFILTR